MSGREMSGSAFERQLPSVRNCASRMNARGMSDGKSGRSPTDNEVAPSVGYVCSVVVIHSWQRTAKSGSLRKARQSGTT